MKELINNPDHYTGASAIGRRILMAVKLDRNDNYPMLSGTKLDLDGRCIDAVESSLYFQNSHAFSVLKYIWRAGEKDDTRRDLNKARWWADRYLGFYRHDPLMLGLREAIEVELLAIG